MLEMNKITLHTVDL